MAVQQKLLVATRKGLFTVVRDRRWHIEGPTFRGDNCSAVLEHPGNGALYTALDHGHFGAKLHRSMDGGANWQEIAPPQYPPKPDDEEDWVDMHGRTIPHSLLSIWCLEADHPQRPSGLWCGTIPGGLFHSADGGDSWCLIEGLWNDPGRRRWFGGGADYPGIHSVCVHPEDPARVRVAVSCGGVWESTDTGRTWTCLGEGWRAEYMPPEQAADPGIQDVHRLVQSPTSPGVLWAQHHNGIFHSRDDGRHWTELEGVTPSAFGFPVAVHPTDPETAWFVPADKDERRIPREGRVVVNRTRDGGRSFETLTQGLPQEHAYDLVYRHGLDVGADGETLALGSTTGSLYVSEDAGDEWQCLSEHLPPIYALRFAPAYRA
ncbi:MAG: hypothetical protein WD382_11620 [Halofilum sp. (in: g-proteobacteria)]